MEYIQNAEEKEDDVDLFSSTQTLKIASISKVLAFASSYKNCRQTCFSITQLHNVLITDTGNLYSGVIVI